MIEQVCMLKIRLRRFLLYAGPAIIVSLAYMDPGNYGTDIQAGASFNYELLWVVWLSSGMAMLLQYLSGKIGIATEKSLSEIIRVQLKKKRYIIPYWISAEIAIAATDLAEYLGTVIAVNLLFDVPLLYAAIFGAFDVLLILFITSKKNSLLERLFVIFVSVISFGYLYELIIVHSDPIAIVYHSLMPHIPNNNALIVSVGIIGATVMPHAIFLHSYLTKNKAIKEGLTLSDKKRLRKLHLIENIFILTIAGMVNAAIMIVAAGAFHFHGLPVSSISEAYKTLVPLFGSIAGSVFLITLLASGISSSVTGTLAGQNLMDGLLGTKINVWLRRIVTRFVNVFPTTIAIILGMDPLNILIYSQVILSILIPLPVIPLIFISSNKSLMNVFVNKKITTAIAVVFIGIIIIMNLILIVNTF